MSFRTVGALGPLQYHCYQSLTPPVQLQIENAARKGARDEWEQQEEKEGSSHGKQENSRHPMSEQKQWVPTAGSYQVTRLQQGGSLKLWAPDPLKGKMDTWKPKQ